MLRLFSGPRNVEPLPTHATEIYLVERPRTTINENTFGVRRVALPPVSDGQVLVRVMWVSADPAMRGWLSTMRNYVPPVPVGAHMRAFGVGRALTSARGVPAGSLVTGVFGWRSACVVKATSVQVASLPRDIKPSVLLGALGITGLTAYFGLLNVGSLARGDTVLVSAAAGATGGAAIQIARAQGAHRVIGVAGGPKKCAYVRDVLGADACIDYKAPNYRAALRAACPEGIDVYFDNVGGETLEEALRLMKRGARVVLCGAISVYNKTEYPGPRNYLALLTQRATMKGFIVTDFESEFPRALKQMTRWIGEGKITVREDVTEGLENAPAALARLFDGKNIGKVVVRVIPEEEKSSKTMSKL